MGTDGERKMSKSLQNTIGIFGDYKLIEKQIMSCFTDPNRIHSTDPGKVEGNPIFIYHDLINQNKDEVEELKRRYRKGQVSDVEVKRRLIAAHKRRFKTARQRRQELKANHQLVEEILAKGAQQAKKMAQQTLAEVYFTLGLGKDPSQKR